MAFDESELEVAQILLQLPGLILDSENRIMFPLTWSSKKQRKIPRFSPPLSSWKTPVSFPNSNLRRGSEIRHQNSSCFRCSNGRSCFCAVKDESSLRKNVSRSSDSSVNAFLIPDLNLPPLIEEEEEKTVVVSMKRMNLRCV